MYKLEFFKIARDLILLFFCMLTDVLSTDKLTQLTQGIPRDSRVLYIAVKMLAAVSEPVPVVKHMSRSLVIKRSVFES